MGWTKRRESISLTLGFATVLCLAGASSRLETSIGGWSTVSLGAAAIGGEQQGFKLTSILKGATTIKAQKVRYPDTDRPEITSAIGEVAPGGESGRHQHPAPTIVHVLEGTSTIEFDDGTRFEAPAGTAFLEAVDTWHNVRNLGDTPLKYLVVFVGLEGTPSLIEPARGGGRQ